MTKPTTTKTYRAHTSRDEHVDFNAASDAQVMEIVKQINAEGCYGFVCDVREIEG